VSGKRLRVALVTNFVQYYRVPVYEELARRFDFEFFFFSQGDESYWLPQHGVAQGDFRATNLPSVRILGTAVAPALPARLWRGDFDVYLSGIVGRFALPVTYLVARLRRRPFVLWTQIWMRIQTPAHRAFFPVTRYLYRHADAVVAGGEHVKRYLVSEGVAPERIFSCGNATRNEIYDREVSAEEMAAQRAALGLAAEDEVVLYVGRFEEAKGVHLLFEAFATLDQPAAKLVVAGAGMDSDYAASLRRRAARADLAGRVVFAGYIANERIASLYSLARVCVVPSITTATFREPWGLIVNEAFGQGVPVVASDCVGAAAGGMLVDGVQGRVVPEGDIAGLRNAIAEILTDGTLRERMSAAARRTLREWDVQRMCAGFEAAIRHAVGDA
jgi:glycosyltransferase involved in cell wall biosynthesis